MRKLRLSVSLFSFLLLTQWACSPRMTGGTISYEISPGLLDTQVGGSFGSPENLLKQVYIHPEYVVEVPVNNMDRPPFHLHNQIDWKAGQRLEHKSYLNRYYIISHSPVDRSKTKVTLLPGRKRILGYPCKKAEVITAEDTAIVWYTNKVKPTYSPWFPGFHEGFVLRIEQQRRVEDREALIEWRDEIEKKYGRDSLSNALENLQYEDIPFRTITRITEAIAQDRKPIEDSLLVPNVSFKQITLDEYNRITKGFGVEQLIPGQYQNPMLNEKGGEALKGKPHLVYIWQSNEENVIKDWEALQSLRSQFSIDVFPIVTLTKAPAKELQKLKTQYPFPADHRSEQKDLINKMGLVVLPTAILFDTHGKMVESIYSGNGVFLERLESATKRTLQ
ncbi:MAG: hypothetical protein AAF694_05015 [Bacteroidota bacterium]